MDSIPYLGTMRMPLLTLIQRSMRIACLITACLAYSASAWTAQIQLYADPNDRPTQFAVTEIESAARARGHAVDKAPLDQLSSESNITQIIITSALDTGAVRQLERTSSEALPALRSESFNIPVTRNGAAKKVWIAGHDSGGAMYGGLQTGRNTFG